MPKAITQEELTAFLSDGEWQRFFDANALESGQKLARAKQTKGASAEIFETGDAELRALAIEKSGNQFEASVFFWWKEESEIVLESECTCSSPQCHHAAAVLEYFAKVKTTERLELAFGGAPQAEKMTQGKTLQLPDQEGTELDQGKPDEEIKPTFLLRVERRPDGDRIAWLPEIYCHAASVYDGQKAALSPAGNLPPIVTPERKIHRDRAAETEALNCLYALNFLPGAEEPPQSLRKLDRPPLDGTLWAPDKKEWPSPEFFWQRFRHEGVPALESRGWEVQFSAHVGLKPLIFRTKTWKAEIVEEGKGWFHLSAGFEIDGEQFELQPILAALVENRFLEVTAGMPKGQEFMIFLPDGRGLALPVGRFRHILQTLGRLMEFNFTDKPIRIGKLDAALLASDDGEILEIEVPEEVDKLSEKIKNVDRIPAAPLPDGLLATLREYQLDGYNWLQFLRSYGLNGILADDMGLGKTLQTLAHILAEKESGRNEGLPSLVVAPTSVVENWKREAEKFAPSLSVLILQGGNRSAKFSQISRSDIVMTSYALLHRDLEVFLDHSFHLIALDEAQHIKNPAAQVSQAVRQLNASHRICLSGTPIENNLGELWSLMNFLMPGMLGTQESFRESYQTPIERNGNKSKAAELSRRLGPLILRRTKSNVAKELPPKTEIVHTIEMSGEQKDLYETVRSTMDKRVRQALAIQGNESQIVFLDALLKLRQICCHPSLLKDQSSTAESAKFEYLVELLDTLRQEKHRVLIFSQFTSMLSLIEAHLEEQGCEYLKLTGETKNRQELVERFQGGEGEVFLISLKAGGTGLTLTGADNVIHYDPWWNPAVEDQATDRAYRIGQDKPVFVHKLICKNTVEERIKQMQGKKSDLAGDLLSGATQGLRLTDELFLDLLGTDE